MKTVKMPSNNMTNHTVDIMVYGCVANFETVACIRNGVLSALALLTGFLCILKLIRLHVAHHQACHQYFIFYCASLESFLASVHWLLSSLSQLDFVLQYLKLIQFLVMCHFYWTLATRALRREQLTKRYLIPFLLLACTYFTVITTLGIINVQSTWIECLQPYWLELSSAELVIVQLYAVAGFYITRRLNEISTLDSLRWSQKKDLWCIIIVFEISALVGFLFDITLLIIGDEEKGCSGIFGCDLILALTMCALHMLLMCYFRYLLIETVCLSIKMFCIFWRQNLHAQELYTPVFITFTILKILLPIWVMIYVFQPAPPALEQEDLRPVISEDATFTSLFNEDHHYRQLYHPGDDHHYRQLFHPGEDYHSTEDLDNPVINTTRSSSNLQSIPEESGTAKTPHTPPTTRFYL